MNQGLSASYFVNSAIFNQESKHIFQTHWLALGRASLQPGEYRTHRLERAEVLVIRASDGVLRAFHNVCRHRGAILCDSESHGILNDGCVTCPYHAWAYASDGSLQRAPNMQSADDWDAGRFGLHPIKCVEWNGYVMVRLGESPNAAATGGSPETFDSTFAPILRKFDPWGMAQLVVAATLTYEVAANWKLLFHNYSECYHCPTVHPALNRLTPYKSAENDLLAGAFLGGPMQLVDGCESMSADGMAVAPRLPGLSEELTRQVSYYTISPTMFISPHPDYVMVHRLRREATDRTRIECDFLFDPQALADGACRVDSAVEFWDQTNRQDWEVCERVQRAAATPGFTPGVYSPLETVLPEFDRYYLSCIE